MIVVFNEMGALICFLPAIIVSLVFVSLPLGQDSGILAGVWGLVVLLWDALYRTFNRDEGEEWASPERGGHFFFIPVCVFGLLAFGWYVHHAWITGHWWLHIVPDSKAPL